MSNTIKYCKEKGWLDEEKEYQDKLKSLKIKLPNIAFHENTPNFVIDITKLPEIILKDYGFIQ